MRGDPQIRPPCFAQFKHINRYWDKERSVHAAKILPGEYYVTSQEETIVTVLGSCVSACVRDRISGTGGMNHFMLPQDTGCDFPNGQSPLLRLSTRYGSYAMESLINAIINHGGQRKNLEFKVFGGGRIIKGMSDVGRSNVYFVHKYLHTEGFDIVSEDVGGNYPRKIVYFPRTGRVLMKKLRSLHNDTVFDREANYRDTLKGPIEGEVELFT